MNTVTHNRTSSINILSYSKTLRKKYNFSDFSYISNSIKNEKKSYIDRFY